MAVGHVAVQGHDSSAAKYNLQFLKMFLNGFAFSFFSPFTFSSPHLTFSFYTLQPFHILRFIIILSSDYHRLNKMAAQSMIFFPCVTLPFLRKSLFIRSLSSLVTYFKKNYSSASMLLTSCTLCCQVWDTEPWSGRCPLYLPFHAQKGFIQ